MRQIILIDDDPICNYLSEILIGTISQEIILKIFTDPIEALSKLETLTINEETMVFLDINMPQMNGFDFLRSFEKTGLKCPFVILTSSSNIIEKENAENNPLIYKFLTKPLTKEHILDLLEVI